VHAKELIDINLDGATRRQRLLRRLLRVGVPVGCVFFMIAAILTIAAYGYYSNRRDALVLSDTLLETLGGRIAEEVQDYLAPAQEAVNLVSNILSNPSIGITDHSALEPLGVQLLRTSPQLANFIIAPANGDFIMPKKMPDGSIDTKIIERTPEATRVTWIRRNKQGKVVGEETSIDDSYDARQRPWYRGAVKAHGLYWSDVYIFFTDQTPGVTASMPVYDADGQFRGVLGADIKLVRLSNFLAGLEVGRNGRAMIIDGQGQLVAYPDVKHMIKRVDGVLKLMKLDELDDPVLTRAFNRFQVDGPGSRKLLVDGRHYLNAVISLPPTVGRNWSVMMVVAEDDFIGFVRKNFRTILLMTSVIVVLASILAGLLVFQGMRADRIAQQLLDHKQELEAQSRAFSELASRAVVFDPDNTEALGEITEIVTTAVAVRRSSVWHFAAGGKQLVCDDCYDRESKGHTRGTIFERNEFPKLFEVLQKGEEIISSDVAADAELPQLYQVYLQPLDCRSLLAVPVVHHGQTAATIWFEHEGKARSWELSEISFARAIAGMLALRFSVDQREFPLPGPPQAVAGSGENSDMGKKQPEKPVIPARHVPREAHQAGRNRPGLLSDLLADRGYARPGLEADVFVDVSVLVLRFTEPFSLAQRFDEDAGTTAFDEIIAHFEQLVDSQRLDYGRVLNDQLVCAAGLGDNSKAHTRIIADVALSMQEHCTRLFADLDKPMAFRIGIDRGAVIGSLLGRQRKFYNIWGDAVDGAVKMADTGIVGAIHAGEAVYRRLQADFVFTVRGRYYLKNVGEVSTYLLTGRI